MGWLFAVALGIQEKRAGAVWRALGPLALGHAFAVGVAVFVALGIGWFVPAGYLRWLVAIVLVVFGVFRLFRGRHPRWVGMRVGAKDLTLWSALMASAHGAGLMVLPFTTGVHQHDVAHGIWAVVVHAAAYLLMTGSIAIIVYEWLGLRLLRTAWVNVDLLWAAALIVTGLLTPLL
jgi:hypothetical protein